MAHTQRNFFASSLGFLSLFRLSFQPALSSYPSQKGTRFSPTWAPDSCQIVGGSCDVMRLARKLAALKFGKKNRDNPDRMQRYRAFSLGHWPTKWVNGPESGLMAQKVG